MEFDWFDDNADTGTCAAHSHRPTPAIISAVSAAYASSPLTNPDGTTGVHLIADYGQGAPFTGGNLIADADGQINVTFDAAPGFGGSEFLNMKSANFAANRNGYFHYVLMPHRYNGSDSSGVAELPGDDTIVSLYCYGSTQQRGQHDRARDGPQPEPAPRRHRRHELQAQLQLGHELPVPVPGHRHQLRRLRRRGPRLLPSAPASRSTRTRSTRRTACADQPGARLERQRRPRPTGICRWTSTATALKSVLTDNNDWATVSFAGLTDIDGARVAPPQVVDRAAGTGQRPARIGRSERHRRGFALRRGRQVTLCPQTPD